MTLAYTILTFDRYTVWWNKPLNVNCPIRVLENDLGCEEISTKPRRTKRTDGLVITIVGSKGQSLEGWDLSRKKSAPKFYAGDVSESAFIRADAIMLVVAMALGAVSALCTQSGRPLCSLPLRANTYGLYWLYVLPSCPHISSPSLGSSVPANSSIIFADSSKRI